ncbi:hypothetical protein GWK47_044954 [Chionoecetes opilio]|uniref:Uncharacterized protein n=1 Tax=Chionoecetes opilio TaxID=41210 RepID=A0A8J4YG03_CHIOP|nr:hypothetical protein GWK47_044954 [Chionoecetes opilio]
MNSRDPFFHRGVGPWAGYSPGTHSVYSSPPRIPYSVPSSRAHQGYVPGGVVYGPSPFLDRDHSPTPPSYGRGPLDHYSSARWTSPASRRRALEAHEDPDPVVFNAGVTFRLGRETHVHRHVDVQPAHATPEAPSAALTRQIDKFLRKSDHALDRYSSLLESRSSSGLAGRRGRSMTPGGSMGLDSPDASLSLRAQRSTSAASIAVKAEKHLEALGPVGRRPTGPIVEREEDDDDLTSSSSDSLDDLSDDTSADLSKVPLPPPTNPARPWP